MIGRVIHYRSQIVATVALTLLLCLSLNNDSLETDEAFSAYIACHRNLRSLWHTLFIGDSSDLQMWLHYCYLHVWVLLFGHSEITLRLANIPFVFLYSSAIVWTRNSLFQSKFVWIAAVSPFAWAYAPNARPYMSIVALSTVFILCLVASFTDPRHTTSKILPWCGLGVLLVGLNFHMLMLLLIGPAFLFVALYSWIHHSIVRIRPWLRPALLLSPAFVLSAAFYAWTFRRGTGYDYARPDLLSMASVLFRFAGLSGFAPNPMSTGVRAMTFGFYAAGMAIAGGGIILAVVLALVPAIQVRNARTLALAAALAAGIVEVLMLSFALKEQIEVRHLACLFGLLLFLLFSAWEVALRRHLHPSFALASIAITATIWIISDWRMTYSAEYKHEDYRAAVARTLAAAKDSDARIAVVADPAAVAYYGLSTIGDSPCFPLPGTCQTALSAVTWPHLAQAEQANFWTGPKVQQWVETDPKRGVSLVLISRDRRTLYSKSPWWAALESDFEYQPYVLQGFSVYNRSSTKY